MFLLRLTISIHWDITTAYKRFELFCVLSFWSSLLCRRGWGSFIAVAALFFLVFWLHFLFHDCLSFLFRTSFIFLVLWCSGTRFPFRFQFRCWLNVFLVLNIGFSLLVYLFWLFQRFSLFRRRRAFILLIDKWITEIVWIPMWQAHKSRDCGRFDCRPVLGRVKATCFQA